MNIWIKHLKLWSVLACCWAVSSALATDKIAHQSIGDFAKGTWTGVQMNHFGGLQRGLVLEELADVSASLIFDVVEAANGDLYLATGNEGKVFRFSAQEQELTVLWDTEKLFVRALALDQEGRLYMASSPEGKIYRYEEGQPMQIFWDPGEVYVWDMSVDEEGNLWVATGQPGRIYRIPVDYQFGEELEPFFEADDTHITRFLWSSEGDLWLGVSPGGLLYRVSAAGELEQVWSTGTKEITALAWREGEGLFFSGYSKKKKASGSSSNAFSKKATSSSGASSSTAKNGAATTPLTKSSQAPSLSNGLFHLDAQGFIRPVWAEAGINIHSIAYEEGEWWLGTSDEGKLYRASDRMDWSIAGEVPSQGEISACWFGDGQLRYVFSSNPAKIYGLMDAGEGESEYVSRILDAKTVARWGSVRLRGQDLEGVSVSTRSGNSGEVDSTWSEWLPSPEGQIASGLGRFLQYKLVFDGEVDAEVDTVQVYFRQPNYAPEIGVINVANLGLELVQTPLKSGDGVPNAREFFKGGDVRNALAATKARTLTRLVVGKEQDRVTAGWSATDPNNDDLEFTVSLRSRGDEQEVVLADALSQPLFSFSVEGMVPGWYQLKVEGTDEKAWGVDEALSTYRWSEAFLIDNTSPRLHCVQQKQQEDGFVVSIEAEDDFAVIEEASYVLNGEEGTVVFPVDGFFDSEQENFSLKLKALDVGMHSLIFKVKDSAGNGAVLPLTFEVTQ